MALSTNKNKIVGLVVIVLLIIAVFIVFGGGEEVHEASRIEEGVFIEPRDDIIIENPYEDVNWESYGQHKANLHTHTRKSDGIYSVGRMIDEYYEREYDILAIADHNEVSWPWENFNRDAEELGMLDIKANEISDTHHIGSYFNDYNIEDARNYIPVLASTFAGEPADISEEEVIREIGNRDGLAVFFHPGRYDDTAGYYAQFYKKYDHLVGMEVVNQLDRYPQDRAKWDNVLTMLMPDRPVWGFSNDDSHRIGHIGHCYNVFLLSDLKENEFRDAMKTGQFYFANGKGSPKLNEIEVDNDEGIVNIEAEEKERVKWFSNGVIIAEGENFNFRESANVGSYIRAEIKGEEGVAYTQPFAVWEEEKE